MEKLKFAGWALVCLAPFAVIGLLIWSVEDQPWFQSWVYHTGRMLSAAFFLVVAWCTITGRD